MPTDAHQDVLYRELSIIQAREILAEVTPLFEELVNNATHILLRSANTPTSPEKNVDLAPLALYRHILEMTDAFTVLIESSVSTPTIPIIRSIFEASLSLEYILQGQELYKRRSLQWLANYARNRLRLYETMVEDSERGKEFKTIVEKDRTINSLPQFPPVEINKAIKMMESFLERDQFRAIQTEYSSVSKIRRNPTWYSLYGGPQNLKNLADALEKNAQYEILYRFWSRVTHAQDFSDFLVKSWDGQPGIKGIRDSSKLIELSKFGATLMVEATRLMLLKFRPGEDFSRYYVREVQPRFIKLIGK